MTIQNFESSTPLVLALADEPDRKLYEEAVHVAELAQEYYDPMTQTSNVPASAGTNGTVCGQWTYFTYDYPTDDD